MTSISPFEHTITTDLAFNKCTSVNMYFAVNTPPFESFAVDLTLVKYATDFNKSILNSFYSLALNFILVPHSIILLLQLRLFIFTVTMKLAIQERSHITTSIQKIFLALAIREIILKLTCVNRSITIVQHTLTFLNTVSPLATIFSSIGPVTNSKSSHLACLPLACVCPATLSAKE